MLKSALEDTREQKGQAIGRLNEVEKLREQDRGISRNLTKFSGQLQVLDEGSVHMSRMKNEEQTKKLQDMAAKMQYLEQHVQILEQQAKANEEHIDLSRDLSEVG